MWTSDSRHNALEILARTGLPVCGLKGMKKITNKISLISQLLLDSDEIKWMANKDHFFLSYVLLRFLFWEKTFQNFVFIKYDIWNRDSSSKKKNSVNIYSPWCHSKPVWHHSELKENRSTFLIVCPYNESKQGLMCFGCQFIYIVLYKTQIWKQLPSNIGENNSINVANFWN